MILILAGFSLLGCEVKPTPTSSKPIRQQAGLAYKVANLVKSHLYSKTYAYDHNILCRDSLESGYSTPVNSSQSIIIPTTLTKKIQEYYASDTPCDAKSSEMLKILNSIAKQAEDYNSSLTILIQLPWTDIDDQTLKQLKSQVNRIAKNSKKINKIILFGLSGNAKNNASIFNALKEKVAGGGIEINTTKQNLENIKNTLPADSLVMTFFVPVESAVLK